MGVLCVHPARRADRVAPSIGLRQRCSSSPAVFRWELTDVFAVLAPRWRAKGYAVPMGENLLQFAVWADDTWMLGKNAWELNEMVHDLEHEAHRQAGLAVRREKCTRVQIRCRPRVKC